MAQLNAPAHGSSLAYTGWAVCLLMHNMYSASAAAPLVNFLEFASGLAPHALTASLLTDGSVKGQQLRQAIIKTWDVIQVPVLITLDVIANNPHHPHIDHAHPDTTLALAWVNARMTDAAYGARIQALSRLQRVVLEMMLHRTLVLHRS